jgi:1-deoxyxylulose-5-phosphate synthase
MIPLCIDQGVAVIPYSPLANGFLAGTHSRAGARLTARAEDSTAAAIYGRAVDFDTIDRVTRVADEHGVPAARIALAWLLGRPGVVAPIIGATKPTHLEDALAATSLQLSADQVRVLEEPYEPREILE